jgi:hypothetical protein
VRRAYLLDFGTEHRGFVFDVLVQASEGPWVESLRTSHPRANIGQVLERDVRTAVVTGFFENPIRDTVEFVLHPAMFAVVH